MKIPKAIRTIEEGINSGYGPTVPKFNDACKLGIKALKWRQHCEAIGYVETCDPLPGETKE